MANLTVKSASQREILATAFKAAMRSVASTVTLIAVEHAGRRYGMVATAMMSVSLEPPTLAVCINKTASIHKPLQLRGAFSVNVLSDRQQFVSQHFTYSKAESRFECGDWRFYEGPKPVLSRLPFLANATAVFFGRVSDQIAVATHSLFIAEIDQSIQGQHKWPLVYCDGSYGSFAE